ncbi:MAG: DUF423 domain-containing protein [Alicyclobacillaceae bacterium]|nr:DUF423 domain-containing protein [Alicyclobacillaceae bacterium]
MLRLFVVLGSIGAFLSVALGAFGAHALRSRISAEMLSIYQTGVHYQFIHSLALILVGVLAERLHAPGWTAGAGICFAVGILLFSGSLYALSTSGVPTLGLVTPFGGIAFLLGWLLLAGAALRGS